MILGLSGLAGAGKDSVADVLVRECGFVKVALADPLKRICKEVFDFSDDQLWGASEYRNAPDKRYVHRAKGALGTMGDEPFPSEDTYLTPRYALQQLGSEWGRSCYSNVWIDYCLRVARTLLSGRRDDFPGAVPHYSQKEGLTWGLLSERPKGVVIPDVRFRNEMEAIRYSGGKLVRVRRTVSARLAAPAEGVAEVLVGSDKWRTEGHEISNYSTLEGEAARHISEREQEEVPDSEFDAVLVNGSSLQHLRVSAVLLLKELLS